MSETNGGTLTVYQRMNDPLEAVRVLGNAIAKSGMFGCGSVEGGQVFAVECLHRNMPPLKLAERYHVIFGKLSMKAEAMLAGFEAEGGKYKVLSRTPDLVRVAFTINGQDHDLSLSWEDAQKEPFPYEGKEEAIVKTLLAGGKPTLKPKYATPRSRMQMLWARLVSDSVRFLCPKVVSGVYTPEENEDAGENNGHAAPKAAAATVVESQPVEPATVKTAADAAVDVPFEVKVSADKPGAEVKAQPAGPTYSTADQRAEIESLFGQLGMSGDQRNAALAKRQVTSTRSLTVDQAHELLAALRRKVEQVKAAADAKLPKLADAVDSPVTQSAPSGPCTPEQDQRIKLALQEWAQIDPQKYNAEMTAFKAALVASGKAKILDLSGNDAARMFQAIQMRSLASFLQQSLEKV